MSPLLCGGRLLKLRRTTAAMAAQMQSYCSSLTCGRQKVNGVQLYYEKAGTGKHAVLLIPGALGSTKTDFQPQLKSLNRDLFTVVGWDPRGYGQSRPPDRDFPLDFFERDARDGVDLMKTLGFATFSLLGWSDGGITALIAAAKNPHLINKTLVWGSNAFVSQKDLDIYACKCTPRAALPFLLVRFADFVLPSMFGVRDPQSGARCFQMECTDEGADGGGVRSARLCQNVASLGGRRRAVCTQTQRKHLHRPSASDPMPDSDRSRRERSDGAQLPPALPPQTYPGLTIASDARRKAQSPPEVS
ncbi:valacyclovir hydrolase isoform X1 [Vanacampus margaritifer]